MLQQSDSSVSGLQSIQRHKIGGNAADHNKEIIWNLFKAGTSSDKYSTTITRRLRLVSLDIRPVIESDGASPFATSKEGLPPRTQAVFTTEIGVEGDMLNDYDFMHGGCTAMLFDATTSLVVPAVRGGQEWSGSGVTSSLNISYYQPASKGETVRLVATTLSTGRRSVTIRGEMWTKRGLAASATHIKMAPGAPKL